MQDDELFFWRKEQESDVELNDVQKEAVCRTEGPLLLLASPGSGKTTTIIMRIGYLIEVRGVQPSRIKAVTFSRASAADMRERYKRLFPGLPDVDFSTIHSLAFEVVRSRFRAANIPYRIIEGRADADEAEAGQEEAAGQRTAEQRTAGQAAARESEPPHKRKILQRLYQAAAGEKPTEDKLDELLTFVSYVKNRMIPPERWPSVPTDVPHAARILGEYEAYKLSGTPERLLDFDDMLTICEQLFREDEALLRRYQARYDYVLTDESQDTSAVQHAIIEQLVRRHRNLCVVADDDQSLYSWRGAEPSYLLDFKSKYPDAATLFMERNYRSSADIVTVANTFIQRNRNRYPKQMYTQNPPHQPIAIKRLDDHGQQAAYLAAAIARCDNLREVAVLYRNNASAFAVMNALDRAGIPYYVKDGDGRFFDHWVVEDVLNFMRMTFTDKRPDILEGIHLKMNGYISKQQMAAVRGIANDASVFDNLIRYAQVKDYQIEPLRENKSTFHNMRGMPPLPAIRVIRERLGYEKALEKTCERLGYRLDVLLDILGTLEDIAEPLPTMEAFAQRLRHLEQEMKKARRRKGGNAVTLTTMHSAKGLEFDRVYMIDLIDGILPSEEDRKGTERMEEAVRLFYVGMTRARRELELVTYGMRSEKRLKESPFVADVRRIIAPDAGAGEAGMGGAAGSGSRRPDVAVAYGGRVSGAGGVAGAKGRARAAALEVAANPNAVRSAAALAEGMTVNHRVFGTGTIVLLDEEQIRIRFGDVERKLLLGICLGQGLLEVVGTAK